MCADKHMDVSRPYFYPRACTQPSNIPSFTTTLDLSPPGRSFHLLPRLVSSKKLVYSQRVSHCSRFYLSRETTRDPYKNVSDNSRNIPAAGNRLANFTTDHKRCQDHFDIEISQQLRTSIQQQSLRILYVLFQMYFGWVQNYLATFLQKSLYETF